MIKNYIVVKTTDENFVGEKFEVNLVHLLMSMQVQIKDQKFYLSEIVVQSNLIILKSGIYEIEIREVL
jgi:hypothetical protein